jgi:hypothetical protein
MPLIWAIKKLVLARSRQKPWADYDELRPDVESYALMEEFLFWVAALHR